MQSAQHLHRFIKARAKDNASITKKQSHYSCVAPPNLQTQIASVSCCHAACILTACWTVWAPPAKPFTSLGLHPPHAAHSASRGLWGFNMTSGTPSKLWGHAASPFTKLYNVCKETNSYLCAIKAQTDFLSACLVHASTLIRSMLEAKVCPFFWMTKAAKRFILGWWVGCCVIRCRKPASPYSWCWNTTPAFGCAASYAVHKSPYNLLGVHPGCL